MPISFENIEGSAHGYFDRTTQRIVIRQGESELQTIKTMLHEISHALLHGGSAENLPNRSTREVQAESVAFAVCQHYGLDTSEYSFGYVAGWSSGKDAKELKESLEVIRSTAGQLIEKIDETVREVVLKQEEALENEAVQEEQPSLADNAVQISVENTSEIKAEKSVSAPELQVQPSPMIMILSSQSSKLTEGEAFTLEEADTLFSRLDSELADGDSMVVKLQRVEYRLVLPRGNGQDAVFAGKVELGSGFGSFYGLLREHHEFCLNSKEWQQHVISTRGADAWEQERQDHQLVLEKVTLKLSRNDFAVQMYELAHDCIPDYLPSEQSGELCILGLLQHVNEGKSAVVCEPLDLIAQKGTPMQKAAAVQLKSCYLKNAAQWALDKPTQEQTTPQTENEIEL